MIPWIQVYSNLPQHPKTARLADELGLTSGAVNPNVLAVGLLVSLWTWAIQNAYNGDLSSCSDRSIAEACLWKKKPETLVKALMKVGFLDADKRLHNWDEYACLLMEQEENRRAKTRERVRRYRDKKKECGAPLDNCYGNASDNAPCNVTDTPGNASTVPDLTVPDQTEIFLAGGADAQARAREDIGEYCSERDLDPDAWFGMTGELRSEAEAFTQAAFARFAGRAPMPGDVDQMIRVLRESQLDPVTDQWRITLPQERKRLLLYAFEAAGAAGCPGDWRYILGVLARLRQRGIQTLADAENYDLERK